MKGEDTAMGRRRRRAVRFLLCDHTGQSELTPSEAEWVRSPIRCFDRAVDGTPGIIAVRFGEMVMTEREALTELCRALKRNSHTQKIPLLALLPAKHRQLMEELAQIGVDFIRFTGGATLSSSMMLDVIAALGPDDRVEAQLAPLCPYLHYDIIDARHEMKVCGAYLDRLVLGGLWLSEVCEAESHLQCEYFLNPRLKS
jgi:hypothetical protein